MRDASSALLIAAIAGAVSALVAVNLVESDRPRELTERIAALSERIVKLEEGLADARSAFAARAPRAPGSVPSPNPRAPAARAIDQIRYPGQLTSEFGPVPWPPAG